jgi:hypothetical protein
MHCVSSVYWATKPLRVSGFLVAHHQEVIMYICNSWYVLYVKATVGGPGFHPAVDKTVHFADMQNYQQ